MLSTGSDSLYHAHLAKRHYDTHDRAQGPVFWNWALSSITNERAQGLITNERAWSLDLQYPRCNCKHEYPGPTFTEPNPRSTGNYYL